MTSFDKLLHPAEDSATGWERTAATRFSNRPLSRESFFPGIFGADALKRGSLRLTFVPVGEDGVTYLAGALGEFVEVAPILGGRTSLVAFFEPAGDLTTLGEYDRYSWSLLQSVHDLDPTPRPASVPADTEHPEWEFRFAGMPMFVVVNTGNGEWMQYFLHDGNLFGNSGITPGTGQLRAAERRAGKGSRLALPQPRRRAFRHRR
ncbi:YqcI/YcgG family protein [Actinomadura sp. DC4]|uniref:YqcI/YcgG family protein n=1 Tax=Actinomadura sp. DC4 TaxID=3055069 RepID=UPI0025AF9C25|nr:YqcI/YcgG family protein [Actinomadura sp. DC4]MDN3357380.1 YqcI/YcgG family protein [Actinomadura sp. DC4]